MKFLSDVSYVPTLGQGSSEDTILVRDTSAGNSLLGLTIGTGLSVTSGVLSTTADGAYWGLADGTYNLATSADVIILGEGDNSETITLKVDTTTTGAENWIRVEKDYFGIYTSDGVDSDLNVYTQTGLFAFETQVNGYADYYDGYFGEAGFYYGGDFSTAGIAAHGDRWIPDKEYVDSVAGGGWALSGITTLTGAAEIEADLGGVTFSADDGFGFDYSALKIPSSGAGGVTIEYSNTNEATNPLSKINVNNNITIQLQTEAGVLNNSLVFSSAGATYTQTNSTGGIQYAAAGYVTTDRSLVDKGYADGAYLLANTTTNLTADTIIDGDSGTWDFNLFNMGSISLVSTNILTLSTGAGGVSLSFNDTAGTARFFDNRTVGSKAGLEYGADYSTDAGFGDRSLIDKGYADGAYAPTSHALLSHTISGETAGHVLVADSATTYSIRQLLGSEINNTEGWTSNAGIVESLTTTGTSGVATLIGGVLNIPNYSSGTIGGSTGSVDNRILRADGTGGSTLQASDSSINDVGDLTLGLTTTNSGSTTFRYINAQGSTTDAHVYLNGQGNGGAWTNNYFYVDGTYDKGVLAETGLQHQVTSSLAGNTYFEIRGYTGVTGLTKGGDIHIFGGYGLNSGDTDGGDVYISGGDKRNSGADGNVAIGHVRFPASTVNFQGMETGIFIEDAATNPSGNPTGGGFMYSDASDGNKLKWRVPGGTTYDLTNTGGAGTILGSVGATVGVIPYGTGVANTITTNANFTYTGGTSPILIVGTTTAAANAAMRVSSTSSTAGSDAYYDALVGVGGDPFFRWRDASSWSYALGVDNNDSNKLKLRYTTSGVASPSTGTSIFEITTGGIASLSATHTSGISSANDIITKGYADTNYSSGGTMDDWILQADSGTNATISDGETVDIAGGTNVTTSISGNTVTINSTDQYTGTVTGTGVANQIAVWNGTSAIDGSTGITSPFTGELHLTSFLFADGIKPEFYDTTGITMASYGDFNFGPTATTSTSWKIFGSGGTPAIFQVYEDGDVEIAKDLDVTGTITGSLSGNATTATTLQTTRTINGVSFNGSANISVPAYVSGTNSTDTTQYPLMALSSATGNQNLYSDSAFYWDGNSSILYTQSLNVANEIQMPTNSSTSDVSFTSTADQDTGINFPGSNIMNFVAGNGTRATLDTGGFTVSSGANYSNNTDSAYNKLSVYSDGNTYGIGMVSSMTYGGLNDWAMTFRFNDEADRGFWWGDTTHTKAQGAMSLTTDGKLTVANSIRLGYGESTTTTPGTTYDLEVSGSVSVGSTLKISSADDAKLWFDNLDGGTDWYIAMDDSATDQLSFGTGSTPGSSIKMVLHTNGDFTLGNTTGTAASELWLDYVAGNSTLHCEGNIVGNSSSITSDKRLKNSIEYMDSKEALDVVMSLAPATFKKNRKGDQLYSGFIAQDVEEVLPHLVFEDKVLKEDEDIKYKHLNESGIIAYLVGAIQELKEEIEELKNK